MIPHAPVDPRTAALLDLIAGDPIHAEHRAMVVQAIVETADEWGGLVHTNCYRPKLTNHLGHYVVTPCVVGATVASLRRAGALEFVEWVPTEGSRTGNTGRLSPLYRLTDRTDA